MSAPATYSYADVPAHPETSRFALSRSATGMRVSPQQNVLVAYQALLAERIAEAEPVERRKTIRLRKVARTTEGAYVVTDAGELTVEPDSLPAKSGKFQKRELPGGAFLDGAFLGAWIPGRDSDLYEAARELAERESFSDSDLKQLNRLVARLVLLRAGVAHQRQLALNLPV